MTVQKAAHPAKNTRRIGTVLRSGGRLNTAKEKLKPVKPSANRIETCSIRRPTRSHSHFRSSQVFLIRRMQSETGPVPM